MNLALSQVFQSKIANVQNATRIDASAADVLRAFAEQILETMPVFYGWRRNGLTAVEHGGVFPRLFQRRACVVQAVRGKIGRLF